MLSSVGKISVSHRKEQKTGGWVVKITRLETNNGVSCYLTGNELFTSTF